MSYAPCGFPDLPGNVFSATCFIKNLKVIIDEKKKIFFFLD